MPDALRKGEGSGRAGSAVLHCDAWVAINGTHRSTTTQYHAASSAGSTGRARTRRPTALKIALQIAAETGGTPGSPTPPGRRVAPHHVDVRLRRGVDARYLVIAEIALLRACPCLNVRLL